MIISNEEVANCLTPEEVIDIVSRTWAWYGEDEIIMPPKITTDMTPKGVDGWFNSMPGYIHPMDTAGIKVVGGYNGNRALGMPYIKCNILLTDPHTGMLKALVAGDWISNMRTGAQPAIMVKNLAPSSDVVTFIGSGLQAFCALTCMSRVLDIKEVRVCDINPEARKNFISKFEGAPFKLVDCPDNESGCRGADVIITLTTADGEFVMNDWVKDGCFVITMGSFHEVDDDIVRNADIIAIDHIEQALHRGNLKPMAERGEITAKDFNVQIGHVLCGKQKYTPDPTKRMYAHIVGMGCPDVVVAETARRKIEAAGTCKCTFDMQG